MWSLAQAMGVSASSVSRIWRKRQLKPHRVRTFKLRNGSPPPKVYGFPGALCIGVNDEEIHGIPGGRPVQPGDLVKLDLVRRRMSRDREGSVVMHGNLLQAG